MHNVLMPQAWPRVDTEMLIIMATGMSAFIPDIEQAIQQTVYDYAITAETVGWTVPGWIEAVSRFSYTSQRAPDDAPIFTTKTLVK